MVKETQKAIPIKRGGFFVTYRLPVMVSQYKFGA